MSQGDGKKKHVGRIVEFFKTTNGEKYFRVQWFYPVEDTVSQQLFFFFLGRNSTWLCDETCSTNCSFLCVFDCQVIQQEGAFHDKRRLFYSTILNDNLLDCIISKVHVTKITPRVRFNLFYCVARHLFFLCSCWTDWLLPFNFLWTAMQTISSFVFPLSSYYLFQSILHFSS